MCSVTQSCQTLCDPMNCISPGPSIHGIFPATYWSGQPFPSPRDLDTIVTEMVPFSEQTYVCWRDRIVREFGMDMSVQSLSYIWRFVTLWTAARWASLSVTNSWSLLKLMSIEMVMPSNHLILCHSLLLLPSIFPSIRVSSNESVLRIRWPKDWSFSFSISPYKGWFPLELTGLILLSKGLSRVFSWEYICMYMYIYVYIHIYIYIHYTFLAPHHLLHKPCWGI